MTRFVRLYAITNWILSDLLPRRISNRPGRTYDAAEPPAM
jgi:hypothetical protein